VPDGSFTFSTPSTPMPYSLHSRCRMDRERFDAGGRECPGPGALTWCARLGEAEAIGVPLAASVSRGKFPRTPVESQPPGRDCVPRQPKGGRGAGHRAGPVADMAGRKRPARVRAGTRAKSISRGLSGSRPEQSGRRALKRGRWISQPSRHAGRRLPDAGQHPASSGPRAFSATQDAGPLPVAASPTPIPEALPACGPPDCSFPHPGDIVARDGFRLDGAGRGARAGCDAHISPSSSSAPEPRIHSPVSRSLQSLKHHGVGPRLKGEDDEYGGRSSA
jgi:hypothetical protein